MATLTTLTSPPTHRVTFSVTTSEGTQLESNGLVLWLYGNEMHETIDFVTNSWISKKDADTGAVINVGIMVDRIIPKSTVMPLCKVMVPLSLKEIEVDSGRIKPSRGCVSMAESTNTGFHTGSFKVHLDDTVQQPIFGKFEQNASFNAIFVQNSNITKDNRFVLRVKSITPYHA